MQMMRESGENQLFLSKRLAVISKHDEVKTMQISAESFQPAFSANKRHILQIWRSRLFDIAARPAAPSSKSNELLEAYYLVCRIVLFNKGV